MLSFKRLQLFEFCDQPWLKGTLREAFMDCLNAVHVVGRPYQKMHFQFARWAQEVKADAVLDLCSGGEHLAVLLKNARKIGLKMPKITASDLFPDVGSYKQLQERFGKEAVDYIEQPTPVERAGEIAAGRNIRIFSICTALHHFSPDMAKVIVGNALKQGDGIMILEISKRQSVLTYLSFIPALPFMILLPPWLSGRFTWQKFLFTTIIPIAPIMCWVDGIISNLRTYTFEEIQTFLPQDASIICEYGEYSYFGLSKSSYFFAYRKPAA